MSLMPGKPQEPHQRGGAPGFRGRRADYAGQAVAVFQSRRGVDWPSDKSDLIMY